MADDWDAEDFEPAPAVVEKAPDNSQWEDEDKEESGKEVKESWEDQEKPKDKAPSGTAKAKGKGKKGKEEKAGDSELVSEALADPLAEKLRQQRLVEESDFKATKELFGSEKKEAQSSLDDFIPKTEEEFQEFAQLVAAKVTPYTKSYHYVAMLTELLRRATSSLGSKECKDLNASLSAIANEKLKKEKEATAGKKKAAAKKQQLKMDNPEDDDFRAGGYSGGADDEYDFM